MPNNLNLRKNILIVGAGLIAREYINVVNALGYRPIVIGRSKEKVDKLSKANPNIVVYSGGIEKWLQNNIPPEKSIVATQVEYLADVTKMLLKNNVSNVLVEKPLAYKINEIQEIIDLSNAIGGKVFVGYNRRTYQSVQAALQLIQKDGGVSSFHFDFTEAVFRINPENYSRLSNTYWGIANSTHVIDTVFYLCGQPKWIEAKRYGQAVHWHPAGSIFLGIGETINSIPFSYHANWGSPGRWKIEIMTPYRKLFFSPMEKLFMQEASSLSKKLVELDYAIDSEFKPGFYHQVKNWLENDLDVFTSNIDLQNHIQQLKFVNQIFGYR